MFLCFNFGLICIRLPLICFVVSLRTVLLPTDLAALFNIAISLVFVYRFDILSVNANINSIIIDLLFT